MDHTAEPPELYDLDGTQPSRVIRLGPKRATAAMAAMGAMIGLDFGREPGYSVDHRGRRWPDPADPAKKAKRKAQRRARRITRRHG